jgi:hypothetical protein
MDAPVSWRPILSFERKWIGPERMTYGQGSILIPPYAAIIGAPRRTPSALIAVACLLSGGLRYKCIISGRIN